MTANKSRVDSGDGGISSGLRRAFTTASSDFCGAKTSTAPPKNDKSLLANHVARTASKGYTNGMKTAISIPDPVFSATERLAQEMNKSRSEVYSLALAEYVARHAPEYVTKAMDKVCAEVGEEGDKFVASAAQRVLERSEW